MMLRASVWTLLITLPILVVTVQRASFIATALPSPPSPLLRSSLLLLSSELDESLREPRQSLSLGVTLNVGVTLEHGDAVIELGSTSSRVRPSSTDSCRVLRDVARWRGDDDDELATSIVESLARRLCSDAHNYHYHHENNDEDGPVEATGTETKGFADFVADLSNFTTSKEIVVGDSNNKHLSHNVAEAQNKRGVRSTRGGLLVTPQKASASKKLETKNGTLSTPNDTNIFTRNFQYTKNIDDAAYPGNDSHINPNYSPAKDILDRGLMAEYEGIFDHQVSTEVNMKACTGDGVCRCDSKPLLFDGSFFSSTVLPALSQNLRLLDFSSPQYKAACWIVHDDPAEISRLDSVEARLRSVQRYVLAVLYFSTSFASVQGKNSDAAVFLSSDSECEWTGVRCEKGNGTVVTRLVLDYNDLSGTIPTELSHLRDLVEIDLKYNKLGGTIPKELGVLASLETLYLKGNYLTGSIPTSLFFATSLTYLNLSVNKLIGTISEDVVNLKQIKELSFGENELTGSIPDSLYELRTLKSLWLGGNKLSSGLTTVIGYLQNLTHLWLESNNFGGSIPSEIGLMKSLQVLDLRNNNFEGVIPPTLANLDSPRQVFLHTNNLSGNMPKEICDKFDREENFTTLEVDSENEYWVPEVNCACCTKGLKPTFKWIGDCPDSKIEIDFHRIYAFNYPLDSYVVAEWSLSQRSSDEIILSDFSSLSDNDKYSVCVASTDCFKFQMTSDNFDEATFQYSIKVNGVSISDESFMKTKVGEFSSPSLDEIASYNKVIEFGYESSDGKVKEGACDKIASICGKPVNGSSNMIQIYNSALKISGRKAVDDISTVQHDVTCHLINSKKIGPKKFVQRYISYLMLHANLLGQIDDNEKIVPNECNIKGIICNNEGIITTVDMTGRQLKVRLSSEIGHLSRLENVFLQNTGLSGPIPDIFRNMRYLEHLNLSNNFIGGTIPGFSLRLKVLDLSRNRLVGSTPSEIGNMLQLEKLLLNSNNLSVLPVMDSFRHKTLKEVRLGDNSFKGNLGIISRFKELEFFDVSENLLTGPLDNGFLTIPSLRYMNVSNNGFHGSIPSLVGSVSNLKELDLSRNQLVGSIPDSIAKMPQLSTLYLQDNHLTGTLSTAVAGLPSLTQLRVSYNEIRGTIPENLMKSTEGSDLIVHLHSNQFEGKAPFITNAAYITDCGFPSAVQNPVTCESCTMCCNLDEQCQVNQHFGMFNPRAYVAFILSLLFLCLLIFYVVCKKYFLIQHASLWKDIDLVQAIGRESIYVFFLARNLRAWLIAFVCTAVQVNILFLYLRAVNIQDTSSDWEYTQLCPSYDLSCTDEKATTFVGYFLFGITMAAWSLEDTVSFLKLFVSGIRLKSIDCFFASSMLLCVTVLGIYTSIVYNRAVATTDTELIMNAVVLLFVSELDERFYEVVRAIHPQWLENVLDGVSKTVVNSDGKGLISKLKKYFRHKFSTSGIGMIPPCPPGTSTSPSGTSKKMSHDQGQDASRSQLAGRNTPTPTTYVGNNQRAERICTFDGACYDDMDILFDEQADTFTSATK